MAATIASCIPNFGPKRSERATIAGASAAETATTLATAEERGYLRGLADAEHRRKAERDEEKARFESELAESRRRWAEEEGGRLAGLIAEAMNDRMTRILDETARVLEPFVTDAIRERAVADFRTTVEAMLAEGGELAITVSGPEDLMSRLKLDLGDRAAGIEFSPSDAVEVHVAAGNTIVETRIGAWMRRLHDARLGD